VIYSSDLFTIVSPVFSVTWYFRNNSNMLICCSRNRSYYQCWKPLFLLNIFMETVIHFFQNSLMNRRLTVDFNALHRRRANCVLYVWSLTILLMQYCTFDGNYLSRQ